MKTLESNTNPHAAGKAAHTPTPWFAVRNSKYWEINTGDCDYSPSIAECCPSKCKWGEDVEAANAAFIVRACNSHEALVEALKAIREEATAYPEGGEDCFKYSLSLIAEKARALLATLEATP